MGQSSAGDAGCWCAREVSEVIGLRQYLAIGAAVVAVGAAGYVWALRSENAALTAQVAGYERSIMVLTRQAEQSALARRVEAARAERYAERAAQLDIAIETILTGGIPDEDLDPVLADFINGLRKTAD